jgi:hypothetical protein
MSYLDDLFSTLTEDLKGLEAALIKASTAAAEMAEADPDDPIKEQAEAAVAAALNDRHEKTTELANFLEEHPEYHSAE